MTIKIKQENKNEELLEKISKLENEIKCLKNQKRYGLVWENKLEKFEKESENALPVLVKKGGKYKDIITNKKDNFNILIEGDNYHALSVLAYTHRNKIDVIYIDPPYNTGNKDFVYNDHYVDKEDRFRHSKWLSFMEKRLKIAKTLLSQRGSIFISIGEDEVSQLRMLCYKIFGEENFIAMFPRKIKGAGKSTDKVANNNDYLLFFSKKKLELNLNQEKHTDEGYKFKDKHFNERGFFKLSQCLDYNTLQYNKSMDYEIIINGLKYYPGGKKESWLSRQSGNHKNIDWVWRWSKQLFEFGYKNDFIVVKSYKNKPNRIYTKTYQNAEIIKNNNKEYEIIFKERTKSITSLEFVDNIYSNDNAKKELDSIFREKAFDYPKPVSLIKKLLEISSNSSSIILDFFAGSGTTGHAVLEVNKQDGGNRQFILCNNNENKICENVTFQRIKRVIEGYTHCSNNKSVEGVKCNLQYLKTDFIKLEKSADSLKQKIVDASTEILCLKENTFLTAFDNYKKNRIKIFQNSDKYTAILFDLFYFDDFIENLKKLKDKPVSIYVFSYTKEFSKEEFGDLDIKFTLEPIPEKILETYKKIFNF